jgi:ATP-binding cassette subfamily F protein uup
VEKAENTAQKLPKKAKLSYKDQRELEQLPELIAALEAEQKTLEDKLADGTWFVNEPDQASQAATRLAEIEEQLLEKLERWTALESQ